MAHHNLIEHKGADMPARFYIDGKRVSREKFEHVEQIARAYGRSECFYTKCRELEGGRLRRINYKTVSY